MIGKKTLSESCPLICPRHLIRCAHPPLLINKLRAYDFSNNALALMRSYFTNRKNGVRISQETVNDWYTTTRDCPQGSAAGPLLWNVFQNDLHLSTKETRLFMYADDHQLFSAVKTTNEAGSILIAEGNNTSEWYNNLLQGNFSKYQAMGMGPRNCPMALHIAINDIVININQR